MGSPEGIARRLDTSVPHPARVYDCFLGGKDNFEADRVAAEAVMKALPTAMQGARAGRAFLARAVSYMIGEVGLRQILDIGTGLPSASNVHEVAQEIAPETRVVYVDNDPIVLMHAEVLLTSHAPGKTFFIEADLREPREILQAAEGLLDFSRPVGLMLLGIFHLIADEDQPYEILRTLLDALPSGSHVAVAHLASDLYPEQMAELNRAWNERARPSERTRLRTREEVTRFFDGLEIVEPGVVPYGRWRPRSDLEAAAVSPGWVGVGRKP